MRPSTRTWTARLIIIATVLAASSTLKGYVSSGHTWASNVVLYYINPNSTHLSPAALTAAIQEAAAIWTEQTLANVQLTYAGTTSGSSLTLNGRNEVFFRNEASGFLGQTYWWYDGSGHLIDGDMILYEGSVQFYTGTGCTGSGIYLEDLAVHEFGHMLGLRHSPIGGATMSASMPGYCDRTQLTLEPDDIAGIEALYPSGSTSQVPTAPYSLSVQAVGSTNIFLSWSDQSSDESGFYVERSTDGSSFARVAQLAQNTSFYDDGLLTPATTYYYRVAAFNGAGPSGYTETVAGQTNAPVPTVPRSPASLSVSGATPSTLQLAWADMSNDESGFYVDASDDGLSFVRMAQLGAGTTSFTASGLGSGTTYWFRVSSFNSAGRSAFSNVATGQTSAPLPTIPTPPSSLSVTNPTTSTLQLAWTDSSSNESGFYIDRWIGGAYVRVGQVGANSTSYTDGGLTAGTVYWYRVTAFNGAGSSGHSNEVAAQTSPSAPTLPAAPGGLALSGATPSTLQLAWADMSNDESGFYVDASDDGLSFVRIAQLGAGTTSFTASGLGSGTTYWFRVSSFNSAGRSAFSNVATGQTSAPLPTIPTPPSSLSVTNPTTSTLQLAWTDSSSNESGFYIDRWIGGAYVRVGQVGANSTSYTDGGLTAGTVYWYRVTAFNGAGSSGHSNEVAAQTSPSAPTLPAAPAPNAPIGLMAVADGPSSLVLLWADMSRNETGFFIERSTDGVSFTYIAQVGPNVPIFFDTGLASSTIYFYRVSAFNGDGNSAYSSIAKAQTR